MDIASLAVFAAALFVAAASPGPAIAAIVARVLGRGTAGAAAFAAGLAIGDVVWLSAAIFGLAVLAQTFQLLFEVLRYAGAAYLLWLAWKLFTAPAAAQDVQAQATAERTPRLFLAGLTLALGNPKTALFYLALVPTLIDIAAIGTLAYAELVAVTLAVLTVVLSGYVILAARARRLFTSARALKRINQVSGGLMAGAALAVATR